MKGNIVEEMIAKITGDAEETNQIIQQICEEGPKHKQEISVLLISRVLELVKLTERKTGTQFNLQDGFEFSGGKDDAPALPVLMPVVVDLHKDPQEIADHIAHAPDHELLAFSICLQGLEWVISETKKGSK